MHIYTYPYAHTHTIPHVYTLLKIKRQGEINVTQRVRQAVFCITSFKISSLCSTSFACEKTSKVLTDLSED